MKFRTAIVAVALIFTSLAIPSATSAATFTVATLSNLELSGLTLKFDALINDCNTSQPTSSFFGSSISPSSTSKELEIPAFQENGSGKSRTTTTLVSAITFPMENKCLPTKMFTKSFTLNLPEGLTFKYIYDQFAQAFIFTVSGAISQGAVEMPITSAPLVLSGPTIDSPVNFSNVQVTGNIMTFDTDLSECAAKEPSIRFFSTQISPLSSKADLDLPELHAIGQSVLTIKTLALILTVPLFTNCKSSAFKHESFSVTLPKLTYLKYIYDLINKKFIYENQSISPAVVNPPIPISFVANRQLPGGMDAGFELIEVNIGIDGTPVITTLAKKAGVTYQIKAVAKDGLIVTAYDYSSSKPSSNTYLISNTKWTLLSTKNVYVEPAVISTDLKTLYGRRVKDAANSTVIFAQNLKTGNTPSYFDATKKGGGFICGVVTDPTFKFGYFTHLTKTKTDIYQIDLGSGKLSKLGTTTAGACIDATDSNGDFIAKNIDPTSLLTQKSDLIKISKSNPKNYHHIKIQTTFMSTGMHSLLPFGEYVLGWNSTNDLHLVGLEKHEGLNFDYLDPDSLSGPESLNFLQYMNNLPLNWRSDSKRPDAALAKS